MGPHMMPRRCSFLFVLAGFACFSSSHAAPSPTPSLSRGQQQVLIEAAGDPQLPAWQRDIMLGLAGGPQNSDLSDSAFPASYPAPLADPSSIDGDWSNLSPPISPAVRVGHTAIYDPVRDRMIVFGGHNGTSALNDVWALSLSGSPAWTQLAPAGTPPSPRHQHSAIYDPLRDRMIVFGGGSFLNDVWALSFAGGPAWRQLIPSSTQPPSGRVQHTAIYDSFRDRMVVYGGITSQGRSSESWVLPLAGDPVWSPISLTGIVGPTPRNGHAAIYDPVRDQMVVFGGFDGSYRNDTWALSFQISDWINLAPAGTPPSVRFDHAAIYDPVRDRMVVFGGSNGSYRNDAQALSLAGSPAWSELVPTGTLPSARYWHTAIYDPVRDRMVVFAGSDPAYRNDAWALTWGTPVSRSISHWSQVAPAGRLPAPRFGHTAIYDPVRDRMIVFGRPEGVSRIDTWELSLSGNPAWNQIPNPSGTGPSRRSDHTAIYDPVRDRMIVFGGYEDYSRNDTWALSLTGSPEWTSLVATGNPPSARSDHTAIYDPVRDRMIVFGGYDGSPRNDTWALTLGGSPAWSQLATTGPTPGARSNHTAIYDPLQDRMVVFGGFDGSYRNDTWALSLGSLVWTQLMPAGPPPTARSDHSAIYDAARGWMVVFGGAAPARFNDEWVLSLAGNPAWSQLETTGPPPGQRSAHSAIYDPVRVRMVVFGGYGSSIYYFNDVWTLPWDAPATPVGVREGTHVIPVRILFAASRPNPSRGEVTFDFALLSAAPVSVVVCDLAGRVMKTIAERLFEPGPHSLVWDRRAENGNMVPSGVYFVRARVPGEMVTRKVVLVR
jgi:hypothetical protein